MLLHVCTDQCTVVVGADTPAWTKAFFWCTHTHAGSCIGMYMDFAITTYLRTVKGYATQAIVPTAYGLRWSVVECLYVHMHVRHSITMCDEHALGTTSSLHPMVISG